MSRSPRPPCATRPGPGRGDRIEAAGGSHSGDVIDAVLQIDDQRAGADMIGQLPSRALSVQRLDAEKHQIGIVCRRDVGRCGNADGLLKIYAVQNETVALPGVDVGGSSDQCDGRTGAREHSAKIAADCAGAHDCDTRPDCRVHLQPLVCVKAAVGP
jgi:hypothetical protein